MHRHWPALALVAVLALSSAAAAAPANTHVTLEADDGESCLSDQKTDCFRVVNGSLDGLEQGMQVHLLLENVGSAPHNAYVANGSDADPNHVDTPASVAINNTETIDPGGNTSMIFQVPSGAESIYIWCDVDGHETGGMWLEASVAEASGTDEPAGNDTDESSNTTDGNDTGTAPEDENTIPSPAAVAVLGAGLAGAVLSRREV